jgi:hypothetical protein
MKHASASTLQQMSDLLDQIRQRQGLNEKKLGIFYRKSKAFLHLHEDPANTAKQRHVLLTAIDRSLKSSMQ